MEQRVISTVMGAVLGFGVGSTGAAAVTGSESSWFAASLTVGQGGTGGIAVGDGGVLTTFNMGIGGARRSTSPPHCSGTPAPWSSFNTVTMSGSASTVRKVASVLISSSALTGAAGQYGEIDADRAPAALERSMATSR